MPQVVTPLLTPENALVVRFDKTNGVSVKHLQRRGNTYAPIETAELKTIPSDKFEFEFSLDPTGNSAPDAGLVVETDSEWDGPWEEEMGTVLGGTPFPFGNEAMQATASNAGQPAPSRVLSGTLTTAGGSRQLTTQGLNRTISSNLKTDGPSKYYALWLPKGVSGQVKFPEWSAAGGRTFRAEAPAKSAKPGKGKKDK